MKSTATLSIYLGVLLICGCQDRPQEQSKASISANQKLPIPEFVGFSLGKTPPPINKCKANISMGFSDGKEICWWAGSEVVINKSLDLLPDGFYMLAFPPHKIPNGIEPNGSIIVIDNIVHRINLSSNGLLSQQNLLDLLKTKYGDPDTSDWKTVTSKGGDHASSNDATWIYKDGYIWFQGITSSMNDGSIRASTYKADEWVKRGFGQNADSF